MLYSSVSGVILCLGKALRVITYPLIGEFRVMLVTGLPVLAISSIWASLKSQSSSRLRDAAVSESLWRTASSSVLFFSMSLLFKARRYSCCVASISGL